MIVVVACLLLASRFTQPDIPKIDPKKINEGVAKLCLWDIPVRYNDKYLAYRWHFDTWYFDWKDRFGFDLKESDKNYLIGYSFFEEAVNCYITTSGDQGLNMALSPTAFKAVFNSVAKKYGIDGEINYNFHRTRAFSGSRGPCAH